MPQQRYVGLHRGLTENQREQLEHEKARRAEAALEESSIPSQSPEVEETPSVQEVPVINAATTFRETQAVPKVEPIKEVILEPSKEAVKEPVKEVEEEEVVSHR